VESRFECWAERRFVGGIVICVAGEIDLLTVPLLVSAVHDQLNGSSRGDTIEVDLAEVVLLSARGISALVSSSQSAAQKGVVFRVRACHPTARRVIDIVGASELLGLSPQGRVPAPGPWPSSNPLIGRRR
jgi:anti-anti-sigma factor